MLATKERTETTFSLAALSCLPETRIWASGVEKQHFIGGGGWLSSTLRWGCRNACGEIASAKTIFQDRLGTNRASGARFRPYGDEITSTANDREKFGTYNRDGFTGLDYADQRYYASTYGRFDTPDPAGAKTAHVTDPSSWNSYSYVNGDPVNKNDRSGLEGGGGDEMMECMGMGYMSVVDCAILIQGPGYVPPPPVDAPSDGNLGTGSVLGFIQDPSAVHQAMINQTKSALLRDLVKNPDCLNWLDGGASTDQFQKRWNGATIGADTFIGGQPVATMGNPLSSTTIAINSNSLFFAGSGPVGFGVPRYIAANTDIGREFILLHEMAHVFGSKGFTQRDADDTMQRDNNKLLLDKCGKVFSNGIA